MQCPPPGHLGYFVQPVPKPFNVSHAGMMPPTMQAAAKPIQITRWVAVGSVLGLILLSLSWELFLAPLRPGGSWLALKALPLCIPLAGLLKNRMYTYRWVSLVVWLYFTEGVVRAYGERPPSNYLAMVEIVLCLLLFSACAMHVRLRFKGLPA
jgi:uncharacterized membrane protein